MTEEIAPIATVGTKSWATLDELLADAGSGSWRAIKACIDLLASQKNERAAIVAWLRRIGEEVPSAGLVARYGVTPEAIRFSRATTLGAADFIEAGKHLTYKQGEEE